MGSKAELLVTVKQSDPQNTDSPIEVVLTSDAAADLTLHWGVKQSGRNSDWKRPSEALLPKGSTLIKDGIAAETPFTGCDEEECQVEIGGSAVPLQRTSVHLPQGHGLTGLVFVIRSQDGTFFRLKTSNFLLFFHPELFFNQPLKKQVQDGGMMVVPTSFAPFLVLIDQLPPQLPPLTMKSLASS